MIIILSISYYFLPGARGGEDFSKDFFGLTDFDLFDSVGSIGLRSANDAALFGVGTGVSFASTFFAKSDLNGFGVRNSLTSSTLSSKVASSEASSNSNRSAIFVESRGDFVSLSFFSFYTLFPSFLFLLLVFLLLCCLINFFLEETWDDTLLFFCNQWIL